ncbi:MAG: hypothetical protein ACREDD_10065 [Methylocella sp.]
MKIRYILHVTLSFLAVNTGVCSHVVAASAFELTETPQEISGTDGESGVTLHASLPASDRVVIDLYFGAKRTHADIDYARDGIDKIRSVYQGSGLPAAVSRQDIIAFQKLLRSLAPKINQYSRHGDALTSLINLIADAPEGFTFNFPKWPVTNQSFTPICPQIGRIGEATFTIGEKTHHTAVLVDLFVTSIPRSGAVAAAAAPILVLAGCNVLLRNVLMATAERGLGTGRIRWVRRVC